MKKIKLRQVDINLLVIFEAVARLGSSQLAAQHLSMSQSAVSHALNRLRTATGDKLFLRGASGLVMTPRASAIIGPARELLATAEKIFNGEGFDPASSERVFRIAATDFSMLTIIPPLMLAVRAEAPNVRLDVETITAKTFEHLEMGWVDFVFGAATPPDQSFVLRELCPVRFGVLVASNHPIAKAERDPTLEEYLAYPHIVTTMEHSHINPVDVALEKLGHRRRIVMASTNFVGNIKTLKDSDLILTTPTLLAMRASLVSPGLQDEPIREFRTPFVVPEFPCMAAWHKRTGTDSSNQWLREMIFRLVKKFNGTASQ